MINYFNSMKKGNKYSLNKGAVVAGVLAATVITTAGCGAKNSKESEQATNHVDKITEIGSMAIDAGSVVSEKVSNIGECLKSLGDIESTSISVYKNIAVLEFSTEDDERKTDIIDMNSSKRVEVDKAWSYTDFDVEYLSLSKNKKQAVIDPNSETPLDNLAFKYDFVNVPELIGDNLVSVAWNASAAEVGVDMDFALLNCTTGETLIPEGTYDCISIEPEFNGVYVYDGKSYPVDFISFSQLGLSQNGKMCTLK